MFQPQSSDPRTSLHSGMLVSGFVIGLLVGLVTALLRGSSSPSLPVARVMNPLRRLTKAVEPSLPADPILKSIAEGKAAAQRRRAELGVSKSSDQR